MRAVLLALLLLAAACGDSGGVEPKGFEVAVGDLAAEWEASMEAAFDPVDGAFESGEIAGSLALADAITTAITATESYRQSLEGLDPPSEYEDDVSTHVSILGDMSANFELLRAAVASDSQFRINDVQKELARLRRRLQASVSPEYQAYAFNAGRLLAQSRLFGDLTPDDIAYLDGVVAAQDEFARRNQQLGQSLRGTYTTEAEFLSALTAAGAGTAWSAVYELAKELQPTARFAEDHTTYLELLTALTETDRLIAEAARNTDMVQFEILNHELGLAFSRAYPRLSPAMLAVVSDASDDVVAAVYEGPDDEYRAELHDLIRRLAIVAPGPGYLFVDQSTEATVAAAAQPIADSNLALVEPILSSIESLNPSEDLAPDHAVIVQFLESVEALHRSVKAAGATGDGAEVRRLAESFDDLIGQAATKLSENIDPVTEFYFDR